MDKHGPCAEIASTTIKLRSGSVKCDPVQFAVRPYSGIQCMHLQRCQAAGKALGKTHLSVLPRKLIGDAQTQPESKLCRIEGQVHLNSAVQRLYGCKIFNISK